ncbi:Transposase, partial [mine drainage metagenome]
GFSPQKPMRRAIERDEPAIRRWIQTDGPRLKKNSARRGSTLVFSDEAGFLMAPLVRRTWAPRGVTPVLPQRGRSRRQVSVIAALSISPRRHRVRSSFGM